MTAGIPHDNDENLSPVSEDVRHTNAAAGALKEVVHVSPTGVTRGGWLERNHALVRVASHPIGPLTGYAMAWIAE